MSTHDSVKQKYGEDYYRRIGSRGGKRSQQVLIEKYGKDYHKRILVAGRIKRGKSLRYRPDYFTSPERERRIYALTRRLKRLREREQETIDELVKLCHVYKGLRESRKQRQKEKQEQ